MYLVDSLYSFVIGDRARPWPFPAEVRVGGAPGARVFARSLLLSSTFLAKSNDYFFYGT